MGTSDVLPSAIGSGGAVISCFSLYSGLDWVGSVFTVWGKMSVGGDQVIEQHKATHSLFPKICIWHSELQES